MSENEEEIIEVANYPYLHIAEFAVSLLEGSDVECFLGDQFMAGIRPEIIFTTGGVKLFVRASDAERAREILAELELGAEESVDGPEQTGA
jgi:hypothetical protein